MVRFDDIRKAFLKLGGDRGHVLRMVGDHVGAEDSGLDFLLGSSTSLRTAVNGPETVTLLSKLWQARLTPAGQRFWACSQVSERVRPWRLMADGPRG